jgi:hypothetical protein
MKIVEIKNIVRRDFPIYYRRFYTGIVVFELIKKQQESLLEFTIEQKPTGMIEISFTLQEPVDYPLIPLQKELKKYIGDLNFGGKLPA